MSSNSTQRSLFIGQQSLFVIAVGFIALGTLYLYTQNELSVNPKIKKTFFDRNERVANCKGVNELKQVLIAINFNFPHYSIIPLLKRVYEPVFGRVVFCGTEKSNSSDDVIKIKERKGYQGYECLATAIRMYGTNYSGYIHSSDDVLLHWWNFKDYDLTKLLPGFKVDFSSSKIFEFNDSFTEPWMWWSNGQEGEKRCKSAFYAVLNFSRTEEGRRLNMGEYIKRYYENTNNRKVCFHAWSDFFYIPGEYADLYQTLSQIYSRHLVFLEIAVPLIHTFFINKTNYEYFKGIYLPQNLYTHISLKVPFYHPFKLERHKMNNNFVENIVTSYGELVKLRCQTDEG